jgi:hypothetical protein
MYAPGIRFLIKYCLQEHLSDTAHISLHFVLVNHLTPTTNHYVFITRRCITTAQALVLCRLDPFNTRVRCFII